MCFWLLLNIFVFFTFVFDKIIADEVRIGLINGNIYLIFLLYEDEILNHSDFINLSSIWNYLLKKFQFHFYDNNRKSYDFIKCL